MLNDERPRTNDEGSKSVHLCPPSVIRRSSFVGRPPSLAVEDENEDDDEDDSGAL